MMANTLLSVRSDIPKYIDEFNMVSDHFGRPRLAHALLFANRFANINIANRPVFANLGTPHPVV